jgi:hypothetical protein
MVMIIARALNCQNKALACTLPRDLKDGAGGVFALLFM